MPKTQLLKYQLYEDVFNTLTGTNLEKLIKIAKDYELYKYKTGIDSPFESALMQTNVDNADFLGSMLINSVDEIVGIPDEVTHKGESLSTLGVRKDTEWTPFLTTPKTIDKDYTIPNDGVNRLLISPEISANASITIDAGATLVIV